MDNQNPDSEIDSSHAADQTRKTDDQSLIAVGVGASAGGLEAFELDRMTRREMLGKWRRRPRIRLRALAATTTREFKWLLDRLSRHAFELGLYDRNERPEGGNDE